MPTYNTYCTYSTFMYTVHALVFVYTRRFYQSYAMKAHFMWKLNWTKAGSRTCPTAALLLWLVTLREDKRTVKHCVRQWQIYSIYLPLTAWSGLEYKGRVPWHFSVTEGQWRHLKAIVQTGCHPLNNTQVEKCHAKQTQWTGMTTTLCRISFKCSPERCFLVKEFQFIPIRVFGHEANCFDRVQEHAGACMLNCCGVKKKSGPSKKAAWATVTIPRQAKYFERAGGEIRIGPHNAFLLLSARYEIVWIMHSVLLQYKVAGWLRTCAWKTLNQPGQLHVLSFLCATLFFPTALTLTHTHTHSQTCCPDTTLRHLWACWNHHWTITSTPAEVFIHALCITQKKKK